MKKRFIVYYLLNQSRKDDLPYYWNVIPLVNQSTWPEIQDVTFEQNTLFFFFAEGESLEKIYENLIQIQVSEYEFLIPRVTFNTSIGPICAIGKHIVQNGFDFVYNPNLETLIPYFSCNLEVIDP